MICTVEPDGTAQEQAPVRNGYRYISNRLDCLDYPRALALDLPIGSGMIESGHRHVLQARLKKAGTAWLRDHADQIAHLRVLRANRQWEPLWRSRLAQATIREKVGGGTRPDALMYIAWARVG